METVTLLGVRGTLPVSGIEFSKYGCATVCLALQMGDELIIVDGGSGLFLLPTSIHQRYSHASILLSHSHSDHLLGIPMSGMSFHPDYPISIFGQDRSGMNIQEQLKCYISPPLWPVQLDALPAKFTYESIRDHFSIGSVRVSVMEGIHPGGVSLFRFDSPQHSVVVATDCTFTDPFITPFTEFARNCDLLICDGQYFDSEWSARSTFGHSTWKTAAALSKLCGAGETRIIHHDPTHTDDQLDAAAAELSADFPHCRFGYEREEIIL